jgi:hypothetical protein
MSIDSAATESLPTRADPMETTAQDRDVVLRLAPLFFVSGVAALV